jgi:cell division protein FtsL
MSTIAQRDRAGRATAGRRQPRERTRPRVVGGGVLWIVLFACLLAGVVAVNVAVLRLNLELDGVSQERSQLKADLASARAGLSSAAATANIERAARDDLGLVQADPDEMIYVTLEPR